MAHALTWSVLSEAQVARLQMNLDPVAGPSKFRETLASFLGLSRATLDARTQILLDFHFYNVVAAKGWGFTPVKTATFVGVMKKVLDEDCAAAHRDVRQSFARLKELILQHSVERPPWSVGIFDEADIDPMVQHAADSYFRHFRLYRMNLAPQVQLELQQRLPGHVDLPQAQRPLGEAVEVTGQVDELELSPEEARLVEREVERRMESAREEFKANAEQYNKILESIAQKEEEALAAEAAGKKGKKGRK